MSLVLGLLACSQDDPAPLSTWPGPEAQALATRLAGEGGAVDELTVRARTAAERLRYTTAAEELEPARAELELCLGAMALLPQAASLPWQSWLEASRYTLPEMAAVQMRAAGVALGAEVLPLARAMDYREMPTAARLEAHRLFWQWDPAEAYARARVLLFQERPRNRDQLRPQFVEEILLERRGADIEELMLDIATSDRMEARARMLSVRWLAQHGSQQVGPILESLFDTEGRNFLLRKEALMAILAVEPARGHRMLMEKVPSREIDAGMWSFMAELRAQEGLPPLQAD